MRSVELFSGAGGLALGLEAAGFETVALVERNRDACATLRRNRPDWNVIEGDIQAVGFDGFERIDLVAGGPPCQPFSMGGKAWNEHSIPAPKQVPERWRSRVEKLWSLPLIPDRERWTTVRDAIRDLGDPGGPSRRSDHFLQPGARSYPGHTGSPLDEPSKALKAGDHGVPGGENMLRHRNGKIRYFTVRESARIQTFPDDWEFSGSWTESMRQLGNAVPVRLAEVVSRSIAAKLLTHECLVKAPRRAPQFNRGGAISENRRLSVLKPCRR